MNNSKLHSIAVLPTKHSHSSSQPKTQPINMTSVYQFDNLKQLEDVYQGTQHGYVYTRNNNPAYDDIGQVIAKLDEADNALPYASGMAAITNTLLALTQPGDHILADHTLYGGTTQLLLTQLKALNVEVTFTDLKQNNIQQYVKHNTKIIYAETIANPTMYVNDIKTLAEVAHENNALLLVDNSFATPIVCQPISLGADVVLYSATKYLGGHSDITAGVVVSDHDKIQKIYDKGVLLGPTLSPFDAWLLLRSIKTLPIRMEKHSRNAIKLANELQKHHNVKHVYFPGLINNTTHNVAKQQFNTDEDNNTLYGGMLSIELHGGYNAVAKLLDNLTNVKLVPSLAGVNTSISYPAKTSHRTLSEQQLMQAGISKALVRISTGLEYVQDIIGEFYDALDKVN